MVSVIEKAIAFRPDNFEEILREMGVTVTNKAQRSGPLFNPVANSAVFVKFYVQMWTVYLMDDFARLFWTHPDDIDPASLRRAEPEPVKTRWFKPRWRGLDD